MIIIPSPLVKTTSELEKYLSLAKGFFERFQIDINDGTYLNNKNVNLSDIKVNDLFKYDAHLLVTNPIQYLEVCKLKNINRAIGQIEFMPSQKEFVEKCNNLELKPGLALDIETSIEKINLEIITNIEVIILMSYPAGKGGQELDERVFAKIEKLKKLRDDKSCQFKICIDGAVWIDTIAKFSKSGVDEVTIGKKLFDGNVSSNLVFLNSLI